MLVDHLSFSSSGGAGIVASLLVRGQVALGIEAELHTITDSSLWDSPLLNPSLTIRSAIDKYWVATDPDAPMFSLARRSAKSSDHKPRPGAILHLHWTEGVTQRQKIVEWLTAGHNVVFTLHDMSPLTGGCHQSLGCHEFEFNCKSCPQTKPIFRRAVESRFVKLPELDEFKSQIAIVAPSLWMREQALRSRHFSKLNVTMIENPIDPSFFLDLDRNRIREELSIPEGAFVACSIAAQIANPAKRIKECIEAFSSACEESRASGVYILVGEGSGELAKQYPFATSVGPGSPEHVARALAASDVLLSGSIAESAGMTIRESSAQGVMAIVVSNGGSDQMVSNGETGFVVKDFEEVKVKLRYLMGSPSQVPREYRVQRFRELAKAKAGLENVSRQYTNLYMELESAKAAGQ